MLPRFFQWEGPGHALSRWPLASHTEATGLSQGGMRCLLVSLRPVRQGTWVSLPQLRVCGGSFHIWPFRGSSALGPKGPELSASPEVAAHFWLHLGVSAEVIFCMSGTETQPQEGHLVAVAVGSVEKSSRAPFLNAACPWGKLHAGSWGPAQPYLGQAVRAL